MRKYEMDLYKQEKRSDCNIILDDVEDVFGSIGNFFNTALDERKSKWRLVGDLFGIGKSLTKTTWHAGQCAVKYAPKAVVTVANAKRELVDTITEEIARAEREAKEKELNERIRRIALSSKKENQT